MGPLAPGEADVWIFRPSSRAATASAGLLTTDEQARAQRLYRRERQLRFSAVRGTLRTILSQYLDMAPLDVPIAYGPQRKPHLSPELEAPIAFNLSHSGGLAAIAVVSQGEVGVDIELRAPRPRLAALADALLASSERAWFEQLPAGDRTKAFFDLWSAKEACSKLIGRGLTMPFSAIALASPEAPYTRVSVLHESAREAPCFVRRLPVAAGYSGALAVEAVGPSPSSGGGCAAAPTCSRAPRGR